MRKEPVVQILELSGLDAELHPVRGGVDDFPHRREGITPDLVESLTRERVAVDDVVFVIAH
jgi:hypothetical protein